MKLATRLESQLTRLFVISAGVGAVVLFSSIYISTSEIKNKAVGFISSHVKAISYAEINSQNVSDIDREVRRLYEAWRGTQDIDIRIEVLLDDKLVGKAGQLQRFGIFSYSNSETYALPSGQKLNVNIQLDLTEQFLTDLMLLVVCGFFLFGCFYILKKSLGTTIQQVTNPLERRVEWLTEIALKLPESIKGDLLMENTSIDEVQALDESLNAFAKQIVALEARVKDAGIKEGRVRMAEQLAHTVKGKLSLLHLRIGNSISLSDVEKQHLNSAVNEVATAAQILLKSGRLNDLEIIESSDVLVDLNLADLLGQVISNKREALPAAKKVSMTLTVTGKTDAIVRASATHLESAFSNIIDNAVEAIRTEGIIQVHLDSTSERSLITISDNGCGIPENILPQLMKERATFGKRDGNGLGLFHAKSAVENLGGSIQITSTEGLKTEVTITLPVLAVQSVKRNQNIEIDLSSAQKLVVLDDDRCIHDTVSLLLRKSPLYEVIHLYSIQDFERWMAENGSGDLNSRVYWMDFDLKHDSLTGAAMIQKYNLQFEAYLVTGMADSLEVQKMAKGQGIRLISKEDISIVQFKFNETFQLPEIGLG